MKSKTPVFQDPLNNPSPHRNGFEAKPIWPKTRVPYDPTSPRISSTPIPLVKGAPGTTHCSCGMRCKVALAQALSFSEHVIYGFFVHEIVDMTKQVLKF